MFDIQNEDPKKDKLLIEIISYVIERGHYDPKQINDNFSEKIINISNGFNIEAKIVGRVEESKNKKLTISSTYGTFEY